MPRLAFLICIIFALCAPAGAAQLVPAGNRNATQPHVPGGSVQRTQARDTTFDAKYAKIYRLLKTDPTLLGKIRRVAGQYDVAPIHIVGAIVGEHTYNVDAYDRLQTYYVKAVSYLHSRFGFAYSGESVTDFVTRPQFAACKRFHDSYDLWTCRERVWESTFRSRVVGGKRFPNNRFSAVFFQPFYAGQTFGIGQLNPLTALEMTDFVHRVSGYETLSANDPQGVYAAIIDPDKSLAYIAATINKSISAYRSIAGFDISKNPGITATLYNLGNPEAHAEALAARNRSRRDQGLPAMLPQENYYGWLVNDKLGELSALFGDS